MTANEVHVPRVHVADGAEDVRAHPVGFQRREHELSVHAVKRFAAVDKDHVQRFVRLSVDLEDLLEYGCGVHGSAFGAEAALPRRKRARTESFGDDRREDFRDVRHQGNASRVPAVLGDGDLRQGHDLRAAPRDGYFAGAQYMVEEFQQRRDNGDRAVTCGAALQGGVFGGSFED